MERTGDFSCSHALLNRLHKNVVYSTLSNTVSLPTDCPQRNERLGWTGDIQVFASTLNFLFDSTGFCSGWLKDVYAEQLIGEGVVPIVVPHLIPIKDLVMPQAVWGDVAALLPWNLYQSTGDKGVLHDQYDSMTIWLDKGIQRDPKTRLWSPSLNQLADWLAPQTEGSNGTTDIHLVSDAYLVHTTRVVAKISRVLGHDDNAAQYEREAEELLQAFHSTYITQTSRVVSDTQTALALLLHFDLVNPSVPDQKSIFTERLEHLVTKCLWQVATGFAGTPLILHVLADNDMLHHAYRMLQAKDSPSWLAPVLQGATTIWERWDSMLPDGTINPNEMTSFNHYALGSVASFLHQVVGGLSPLSPGWREILVKPQPGGTVTSASNSYVSSYGRVACAWEIKEGRLVVNVEIPPNCTAVVELPGVKETIGSGRQSYDVDWVPDPRFPPKLDRPAYMGPVKNTFVP
jgi:alpha-L-rhamnosidase